MPDKTIRTEFLIHDLKVPIAVIDAGARLLLEQQGIYGPLTDKQIKVLNRILRNALMTRSLVNDVLEIGKSRQGITTVCDISILSLVSEILMEIFDLQDPAVSEEIMAAGNYSELAAAVSRSGICLSFDEQLLGTRVCLDEDKTKQILRNLVINAFKYCNAFIKISGYIEKKYLVFSVEDDGQGIAKEEQHLIFEPYCHFGKPLKDTVKAHGLGLAAVKVLIKDMGGTLDLESEKGKGATFTITIPLLN